MNARHLLTALAPIAAALVVTPALADDTQYWQTVTVNVALPDDFKVQNETVFRTSDARGFYELENNFSVGKKLNKKVTVWLGYTFDPLYNHGTFVRREHRFRQQINVDNFATIGKVRLSGRVRLEERWREGISGTGWRLRPQVKATAPLAGKVTISVSNEAFLNLNNTAFQTTDGLDRMRTSVSIGVPLSKKVGIDFGYLNQHGFVRNGADTDDHVLTLGITGSF